MFWKGICQHKDCEVGTGRPEAQRKTRFMAAVTGDMRTQRTGTASPVRRVRVRGVCGGETGK